jgi:phage RecT family recombinase
MKKSELDVIKPRFIELTNEQTFIKECSFATQHFNRNDYLNKATTESKLEAVMNIAMIGLTLNPVLKLAYLVPRSVKVEGKYVIKCHLEPSYQGLVKLITDTGSARTVYSHVVYDGDEFEILLGTGTNIIHKPKFTSKVIKSVYAVAILPTGEMQVDVMPFSDVEEIRNSSESYKAYLKNKNIPCIWVKHEGEMAKKTIVKRLCKYIPKTNQWDKISTAIDLTDKDFQCSLGQMSMIESLLVSANMLDSDKAIIDCDLSSMSFSSAQKTIEYLKENQLNPITHSGNYSKTDIIDELNKHRESD